MVHLATGIDIQDCRQQACLQLENGAAFKKFVDIIAALGGDVNYLHDTSLFKLASIQHEILAPVTGYISAMNAEGCGLASCLLGAGRQTVDEVINHGAGITLKAKTGDFVNKGDVLAICYTDDERSILAAQEVFLEGFAFTAELPVVPPLVYARVTKDEVKISEQ